VGPLGDLLDELPPEDVEILMVPAGEEPAIDGEILVDPGAARVLDVGLQARPRGDCRG